MARDITVTFDDGSSHVYANAPDSTTFDQALARAQKDFAGRNIANIDGGRRAVRPAEGAPAPSIGDELVQAVTVSEPSSTKRTSVLEGARAPAPLPTEDPMLRPEFVRAVETQLGALPAEQRAEALDKLVKRRDVYGRAARVVKGRFDAMDKAGEALPTISGAFDPRLEAQTKKLITEGGMEAESARAYAQQELARGVIPRVLPKFERDIAGEQAAAAAAMTAEEMQDAGFMSRVGAEVRSGLRRTALGSAQIYADITGDTDLQKDLTRYRQIESARGAAIPKGESIAERSAQQALATLTTQAPMIVLSAMTGTALPVLGQVAFDAFSQSYGEARGAGKTPAEAATRAGLMATAEVVFERFGLAEQLKAIRGVVDRVPTNQLSGYLTKALIKDLPAEQATTLSQFLVDKLPQIGLAPDAGFKDYLEQAGETLRQTVIQSGASSAAIYGAGAGARALEERALTRELGARDFEQAAVDEYARRALSPEFYRPETVIPGVRSDVGAPETRAPMPERPEEIAPAPKKRAPRAAAPAEEAPTPAPVTDEEKQAQINQLVAIGVDIDDAVAMVDKAARPAVSAPAPAMPAVEAELTPEVRARIDELTDEYVGSGLPPKEARALAIKNAQREAEADAEAAAAEGEKRAPEIVTPPSGEGVSVAGEPAAGAAPGRPARAKRARVVPPAPDVGQPSAREGEQPGAVTEEAAPAPAPAPAAKVEPTGNTADLRELGKVLPTLYEDGEPMSDDDLRLTRRNVLAAINTGLMNGTPTDDIIEKAQIAARDGMDEAGIAAVRKLIEDKRAGITEEVVEKEEAAPARAPAAAGPTERQQKIAFGKALGLTQPYPGILRGRVNLLAQKAAQTGNFAKVLEALEKSKNVVVAELARRAKNLRTKIVIDEEATEQYTAKNVLADQMSIDGAKMHLGILDKLRELAPEVAALPDKAEIPYEIRNAETPAFSKGEQQIAPLRLPQVVDMNYSMFAPLGLKEGAKLWTKKDFNNLLEAYEHVTSELGEDKLRLTASASVIREGVAGYYDANTDTIHVPEYYAKNEHVLAHEVAHAQAAKAVANPTPAQKPIVKRLEKLYAHVKKILEERQAADSNFSMPYGVTNVQEFLAEGVGNGEFQYTLSRIKYENTTAWSKFVETIANLLGLKADNAFTELLQVYSDLTDGAPKLPVKARGRPKIERTAGETAQAAQGRREQTLQANKDARAVATAEKQLAGALAPIPKGAPQMARQDAAAARKEAINTLYALSRRNKNKPGQRAAEALKNPKIKPEEIEQAKADYEASKQKALPARFPSVPEEPVQLPANITPADKRTAAQIEKETNKALDNFETSATATDIADNTSLLQSFRDIDKLLPYFKGLYEKLDGARLTVAMNTLTNDALARWASSYIPELNNTNTLLRKMRTMSRNLLEGARHVSDEMTRAFNEDPDLKRKLERVTSVATDIRVDPSKGPRKGAEKLTEAYNDLGAKGQALFRKLRDYYAKLRDYYEKVLDDQIAESNLPPNARRVLMAEIKKMYETDKKIDPFFPFVRNRGNLWLRVGKGQGRKFFTFANQAERRAVMEYIAKNYYGGQSVDDLLSGPNPEFDKGDTLEGFRKASSDMTQSLKKIFEVIDDSINPETLISRVAELRNVIRKGDPNLNDKEVREKAYEQARDELTRDLKDSIYEFYLITLPDQSFRNSFIARKDIPGYNVDITRNFATYAVKVAKQLPRIKYGPKLRMSLLAAEKSLEGDKEKSKKMRFVDEMTRRVDLELNPALSLTSILNNVADFATRLSFVHYLSAGASAIVQATAFLYGLSTLGARYGYGTTAVEISKMMRIWNEYGVARTNDDGSITITVPSVVNSKSVQTSPLEKRFVRDMMGAGIGEYTLTSEMLNRGRLSTAAFEGHGSKLGRGAMMLLSGPFTTIERLVQETLAIPAFRMAMEKGRKAGLKGEELYEYASARAIQDVYDSVGNMSESNRPPLFRNAAGRILLQFMIYPLFITVRWMREAYRMVSAKTGAEKYEAFKEFSGIMGVTWMLSGLQGLPFFSTIMGYIGAWLEDEDEKMDRKTFKDLDYWTWWRTVWLPEYMGNVGISGRPLTEVVGLSKNQLAALIERGPTNVLTGLDIASRTSINPTDMFSGQNKEVRTTREGALQFAEDRAGPFVGMILSYFDAYDAFADGDYQRGMEKMLPAIARNPAIAFKYYNEGIKDYKGATILKKDSMTTGRLIYQAIGFRLDEVANQQKFNFTVAKIENKVRFEREDILKNLRDSYTKKDFGRYRDWMKEREEFNRKYPSYAIDDDAVVRSVTSGAERAVTAIRGFTPTEQNIPIFREAVVKRSQAMREFEERTKK